MHQSTSVHVPVALVAGDGTEGFCVCVTAGIPSTEKVVEIIDGLKQAGIKHVAFKPGSVERIRQVINIAATNPTSPLFPGGLVDVPAATIHTRMSAYPCHV
jgi:enoyl reductase-like protein